MQNSLPRASEKPLLLEYWKPILEWEGIYEVSNVGNVRRVKNRVGRLLKPQYDVDDRLVVSLSDTQSGRRPHKKIHRLVAGAFLGLCPPGCEVNHKDGKKRNNRASNLEYVTPAANREHAYRTMLNPLGENHGNAKLTIDDIRAIRDAKGKMTLKATAKMYGVTLQAIHHVQSGKLWKHVK